MFCPFRAVQAFSLAFFILFLEEKQQQTLR